MAEAALGLRARLLTALQDNGADVTANLGMHSWRCEYYWSIDGPCACVDKLLDDLVCAALTTEE